MEGQCSHVFIFVSPAIHILTRASIVRRGLAYSWIAYVEGPGFSGEMAILIERGIPL